MLFVLVGLARIAAEITCDDKLIEPVQYKDISGDSTSSPYVWFCPTTNGNDVREIDVYRCTNRKENECTKSKTSIGSTITTMTGLVPGTCQDKLLSSNWNNRVTICMPWENNGLMTHLRKQFVDLNYMSLRTDKLRPEDTATVRMCNLEINAITFTREACWYTDNDILVLKPRYRFNFIHSTKPKICMMTHEAPISSPIETVSGVSSYDSSQLSFYPQVEFQRYLYCEFYGRNSDKDLYDTFSWLVGGMVEDPGLSRQTKQIQFHDYRLDISKKSCTDFVTKPCFDNAFSFAAQMCLWVHKAHIDNPISLQAWLNLYAPSDTTNFQNYGDNVYEMNVENKNIQVWVKTTEPENWALWNGGAIRLTTGARLYVVAKSTHSCSGCTKTGEASTGPVVCGVPHECKRCGGGQFVNVRLEWMPCVPSFPVRTCKDCSLHHNRSSNEVVCIPCPPLWPMRRKDEQECAACEHTQYFDAGKELGCEYLKSVANGLFFESDVSFNAASYDEYIPTGSDKPRAVPAQHYRDLLTGGNAWNSSTRASPCEPSEFRIDNSSVADVVTRNMDARRIQFRSWCGHREILKSANAQLRLLRCVQLARPVSSSAGSVFVEPDRAVSLRDLLTYANTKGYALKYERSHVENAGIKSVVEVTLVADYVECHYEIRREGRTDDCTQCTGTQYTRDCGPTYNNELAVPAQAGNGSCAACETRCFDSDSFFAVERLSCWSNGTRRVSAADATWRGRLDKIQVIMSPHRNYWYKTAPCRRCARLQDVGGVPWVVARCGNRAWFETWHPTVELLVLQVIRPRRRLCCALDNTFFVTNAYNSDLNTRCVDLVDGVSQATALNLLISPSTGTPLCMTEVPDLQTELSRFCPPGWFVDKSALGCDGLLDTWNHACCSKCSDCATSGKFKTNEYIVCPGDTVRDTQLAGCVTTCAEKNYQVNDTCVACESCA